MNPQNPVTFPAPADDPQHDEAERKAARDALRQRLQYLFRRCRIEDGGADSMLFKTVSDYRLENLR